MSEILININALGYGLYPTKKDLAQFLGISLDMVTEKMQERYKEITTKETHCCFTPCGHEKVLERIIKPLVTRKKHYIVEEYLSAIALSGLVAEMLAILVWKMSKITIKGKKLFFFFPDVAFYDFEGFFFWKVF